MGFIVAMDRKTGTDTQATVCLANIATSELDATRQ